MISIGQIAQKIFYFFKEALTSFENPANVKYFNLSVYYLNL